MAQLEIELPEVYRQAYHSALDELASGGIIDRIWDADYTVWSDQPDEIVNRLGWLDIAERMRHELADLDAFAGEVAEDGYRQAVLMGMGGSSLAPDVLSKIFPVADGRLSVQVLDSTDPAAVSKLERSIDLAKTLFLVSTKSGTTVETLSFFKYFYNKVAARVGDESAGRHFAAITDPGSPLVERARRHSFRRTFANDPNIGGRYSALTYVGLAPAALMGMDLERLLDEAIEMAERCRPGVDISENPAARLGSALGELAKAGRDKLTLLGSPAVGAFGDWVEQLIAESTGKSGTGILPVVREPVGAPGVYGPDRVFVSIRLHGEHIDESGLRALAASGHPIVHISLPDRYSLGGQIFMWELATAIAGQRLGIHPFNQPNVEAAKQRARKMTETYREQGQLPQEQPLIQEGGMAYYFGAPAETSQETLPATLRGAISELLGRAQAGSYVALQAYLPPSDELDAALRALRVALRDRTRLAVTLGYGPRYLHSTGQLHKGDAGKGLFLQLTGEESIDLPIPERAGQSASDITFGTLIAAQALGDRQALADSGRKVARLDLGANAIAAVRTVTGWLA
jgi:glucose-6-phosphate isomerase